MQKGVIIWEAGFQIKWSALSSAGSSTFKIIFMQRKFRTHYFMKGKINIKSFYCFILEVQQI